MGSHKYGKDDDMRLDLVKMMFWIWYFVRAKHLRIEFNAYYIGRTIRVFGLNDKSEFQIAYLLSALPKRVLTERLVLTGKHLNSPCKY